MASVNKVNADGALLFEQPFARVPYESYRKVFRTSQKYIERELGAVQTASNDLAKQCGMRSYDAEGALKSVDGMIGRVEGLKRKLSDLQASAGAPTLRVMRDRAEHLAKLEALENHDRDEQAYVEWTNTRLDRWIVDWMLRKGMEKTARSVAGQKEIERFVDIDLFTDMRRIEKALHRQSCAEALAWCSENKTALRKIKSTLEFDLRLQEYIELARARKSLDAIAYLKKYLVSWQDSHIMQIRQASALLAYSPETTCSPYRRLYDKSRWIKLAKSFREALYALNAIPTEPLLHLALYAGLASLKLPACYTDVPSNTSVIQPPPSPTERLLSEHNPDCPVCDRDGLGELAKEVPWSHHLNSTIVCRISGKIMDGDNWPMAFPNGQVYSKCALEEMLAKSKNGKVMCPHTRMECEWKDLRKVFIS